MRRPPIAALLVSALLALPAAAQTLTLRQGSNAPPGSVYHQHWLAFEANLEKASGGAIQVELNTNEPNEANLLSNLRRGRVDCAGVSLQGAATVVPEVAVLQLPHLFGTLKEVDHVYGQPALSERFRALFAARGLHMLSWVEVGFTNLYGTRPIKTPADIQGAKLRATQSRASQNFVKAAGAEAVVLAIADALPGLQTGLIVGGESGAIVYDAVFARSAPHYTLTQHAFDSGVILCHKPWWDRLTPAQAQQVVAAWDNPSLIRNVRAQNERLVNDVLPAKGVTVHRPSAAEQAAWRAVGERSAGAVMATLPPEAAALREEIRRAVAAASK
jgi:TRAP-type C4-dicarboxylate transport system substrate-binding protein